MEEYSRDYREEEELIERALAAPVPPPIPRLPAGSLRLDTHFQPQRRANGEGLDGYYPDTSPGSPLQRQISKTSADSSELALSPSFAALGLKESDLATKPRLDPTKPTLRVRPSDHAGLKLSGRIISVAFCLPHELAFTHEEPEPWTIKHRVGTTALYDSFAFLSSPQASFKHFLIGWTGEIVHRRARRLMTRQMLLLEKYPVRNPLSTPVPINGEDMYPEIHDKDLNIRRCDRNRLEQQLNGSRGIHMIPVWLTDKIDDEEEVFTFTDQDKWREFSEKELHQLLHYKYPDVVEAKIRAHRWDCYVKHNKMFADRILEMWRPGDTIIVHDYQLMLVPGMLRARVADIKAAFVLHSPFPSYEYFRCLGPRAELIQGMLGADTIIFQSRDYAIHFGDCCRAISEGYHSSSTAVETPSERFINLVTLSHGFDTLSMRSYAFGDDATVKKVETIIEAKERMRMTLIVGRDRLETARGVVQKFLAFESFLDTHPEWRRKVILFQLLTEASVEDIARGGDTARAQIDRVAAEVNSKFGSFSHVPIVIHDTALSKDEYYALLRTADMCLVTSVRESINTAAIEFAVMQRDSHHPIVMSEFCGSTHALPGAIIVNPHNFAATGEAIQEGLTMSAEARREMYEQINRSMHGSAIHRYLHRMLRQIYLNMEHHDSKEERPDLDPEIIKSYSAGAAERLFIFDYDGTLTPIVNDPDAALPSDLLLKNLETLAADPRNTVWIVSGRSQDFLVQHLGHIRRMGLSAEHGCFLRYPEEKDWCDLTRREDALWKAEVVELFTHAAELLPGTAVESKRVGVTFHYRRAESTAAAGGLAKKMRKSLKRTVAINHSVEVMEGKANLEVRPRLINKGAVVKRLLRDFGKEPDSIPGFIMCAGDDTTDEDMFRALRRSEVPMEKVFAILVGNPDGPTIASWRVKEPQDVIGLLGALNEVNKDAKPGPRQFKGPILSSWSLEPVVRRPWMRPVGSL